MIFFRKYSGELTSYSLVLCLLGFSLFRGGLLFLRYTPPTRDITAQKQIAKVVDALNTILILILYPHNDLAATDLGYCHRDHTDKAAGAIG